MQGITSRLRNENNTCGQFGTYFVYKHYKYLNICSDKMQLVYE